MNSSDKEQKTEGYETSCNWLCSKQLKVQKVVSQISILMCLIFYSKSESNSDVNIEQEQSPKQISKVLQNSWGSSVS